MDRVVRRLESICDFERHGGRLRRVGDDTVLLLDLQEWPHAVTSTLRESHPNVVVDVRTCAESVSGFCVVLRLGRSAVPPILLTTVLCSAMAAVVVWCLQS